MKRVRRGGSDELRDRDIAEEKWGGGRCRYVVLRTTPGGERGAGNHDEPDCSGSDKVHQTPPLHGGSALPLGFHHWNFDSTCVSSNPVNFFVTSWTSLFRTVTVSISGSANMGFVT